MTNELHVVNKDTVIKVIEEYVKKLAINNFVTESFAVNALIDIIRDDIETLTISYPVKGERHTNEETQDTNPHY